MQIDDDPGGRHAVQDFLRHSELLKRLDWSNRMMAALIRGGYLGGERDRVSGQYFTSKVEIIKALKTINELGNIPKVDLSQVESEIAASPSLKSKRKQSVA